jgi:hypothetical protein
MKDPASSSDSALRVGGRLAQVRYTICDYQVIIPGDHVLCAVTGEKIPLVQLKYWSAELQEAYVDGEASSRRWTELSHGVESPES